jgi:hypothetical protein
MESTWSKNQPLLLDRQDEGYSVFLFAKRHHQKKKAYGFGL